MKETRASGGREFIYTVVWALLILMLGRAMIYSLPEYKIIGWIVSLLMFCSLCYFVLTRYSAQFTYEDTGESLRINRMIGKRNREHEIRYGDIISIDKDKPSKLPRPVYYMRSSALSGKKSYYIVYGYKGAERTMIIEASDKFVKSLRKSIRRGK